MGRVYKRDILKLTPHDERIQTVVTPDVNCNGLTDDWKAIQAAVDKVAAKGGGVVYLPMLNGGSYVISQPIVVSTSNITILLEADIKLSRTLSAQGEVVCFKFIGLQGAYIENVALLGYGRTPKIDGNGSAVTDYTYNAIGTLHPCVKIQFVKHYRVENIYAYNGLVNGLVAAYCIGNNTMLNVSASHTRYDNGFNLMGNGEPAGLYSESDPGTWHKPKLINCSAWSCMNHGIGIWGAMGANIVNPKIWLCGNNTGTGPAGPAGGLAFEYDPLPGFPENLTKDHRITVTGATVENCYGFGIRTNVSGVSVIGGHVKGIKVAPAYTDDANPAWGSGVFVQVGVTNVIIQVDISDCQLCGLRLQGAASEYPSAKFKGNISNSQRQAIWGIGIAELTLDPSNVYSNNGLISDGTTNYPTIELNNLPFNTNAGIADLSGRFDANKGQCIVSYSVGYVTLTRGVAGRNNLAAHSSAFHAVYIDTALELKANNISLSDSASKQARVLKAISVTKAYIDRASITGDQTNAALPKADVAATTLIGELIGSATYDPPSIAANSWGTSTTVTVTGAIVGDVVTSVIHDSAAGAPLIWHGKVTAANTVTCYPYNPTASAIDPSSSTLRVTTNRVLG